MVARPGHVGQRDLEAHCGAAVRLLRWLAGGPLRPPAPHGRGDPHGRRCARRARDDPHAGRLLSLLLLQRLGQRVRRPAPEPGASVALVHGGAWSCDGVRLCRDRRRRRVGAVPGGMADPGGGVAGGAAGARRADCPRRPPDGAVRSGIAQRIRLHNLHQPAPSSGRCRLPCSGVLSLARGQHVLDCRRGRHEPALEALLESRSRLPAGRGRAGCLAGARLEPGRPAGDGMAGRPVPEEVRHAADLCAGRVGDPALVPGGHAGGDLSLRPSLRHRAGWGIHGHSAHGRRAVRCARLGTRHGRRADGGRRRRGSRAGARRPHARRVGELRHRLPGGHRVRARGGGGDPVPAAALTSCARLCVLTPCPPLRSGEGGRWTGGEDVKRIGIIMNGVTGRMGLNQHLVRSILAIREQGGVRLSNGDRLVPDPILVGRSETKLREIAAAHGLTRVSTDLDACLANPADEIYFDATVTSLRVAHVGLAIAAGKHVYCEKPVAATTAEALELASSASRRGVKHGVVQDKLFLPGIRKLKRLVDAGFFGRILSVRGEFGYWVFEGDGEAGPAQRPSWNYRKEDGGGIILDMFAHWRYLLDHTFGPVTAVQCTGATHIAERVDEQGRRYAATADDAAYATFVVQGAKGEILAQFNSSWAVRVYRDDLLQIQVDGTHGSAVATLRGCKTQRRAQTPRAVWNPDVPNPADFYAPWQDVPDEEPFDNAFKVQWERFLLHVATDAPFPHDFREGAKGVQLADLALRSWAERRWVEVPRLEGLPTRVVGAQHAAPLHRCDAMLRTLRLPLADGTTARYTMREPVAWRPPTGPIRCRVAYAAAHVVSDPLADADPLGAAPLDWEATLAYRRHLWSLRLAVAEAMDTAQRGMGLDWRAAQELIRRSLAEARATGGAIACGAGTDQLAPAEGVTLADVEGAYEEQVGYGEGQGGEGGVVLMASRALARAARGPDDYARVYGTVL